MGELRSQRRRGLLRAVLGGITVAFVMAGHAGAGTAAPITSLPPAPCMPEFSGSAATPRPVADFRRPPQNPFLAKNPFSNIHNDTWMTDAYPGPGPTGRNPVATSGTGGPGICATLATDSRGRLVSVCPSLIAPPQARIIDPETLETIATYDLPEAPPIDDSTPAFQDYTSGG